MTFPAYPAYEAANDPFLGSVPEHWRTQKLRFLCSKIGSGKTPRGGAEAYTSEGIAFIRSQNVYDDGIRLNDVVYISRQTDEEMAVSRIQHGDILLNITGASLGRTCFVSGDVLPANVNQHVCIIRLTDAQKRDFVAMAMKAFAAKSQIASCQTGAAREGLNFEQIGRLRIAIPPLDERTAITNFLDRETSKIDGLVAEQRRLIALLKEMRQAVISHAVTKGLNPTVPMKPSGIPWLGDVPEHWEVVPLRRLVTRDRRITYGIVQPGQRDESGRYMVRGQDYSFGWANSSSVFRVADAVEQPYKRSRLRCGDLVMTIVGAGVGNVAVVPKWLEGANITQTTARIAIDRTKANSGFVEAVLTGPVGKRSIGFYAKGAAQPGLNLEHVKLFPITLPPLDEQTRIAQFLEATVGGFDTLQAGAERAIELLQERRTALISAAVTGKIDVREHAPQETA